MGFLRALDLWHVPAVQLHMLSRGKHFLHVAGEADRHDAVTLAPHEQRLVLESREPRPEAVLAVRLFEVDVAGGRIEGRAAARPQGRAQELVDARGGPAVVSVRDQALDDAFHDGARRYLQQAELRSDEP